MQLSELVAVVRKVRATTKKNEKITLLAECLRQAAGTEIELTALYLAGLLPQGKIGVGWRLIQDAMTEGPAAGESLTLSAVQTRLDLIARDQGSGSADRKIRELRALFGRVRPDERRFLSQLLVGELQQGALEGLVIEAIAKAADCPAPRVREAFMFSENIGAVARAALESGTAGLDRFSLTLFKPVSPMLANSAETTTEALSRLGEGAFEYKLDGVRIQAHKGDGEVRLFTRQLQDVTDRIPEVVELIRSLPVRAAILEGEAIALRSDGRPRPFQTTIRRLGRRKDVESLRQEVPLSTFLFDCLYISGEGSLIAQPYQRRVDTLRRIIPSRSLIPHLVTGDPGQADHFLRQALDAGHEGVMAKSMTAPYTAGQRGFSWLKLKAAITLDLVILAAEWGHGRRSGWLSNLHLGARDTERGQFVMLGKTFKGLTDDMLIWQTQKLLTIEDHRDEWTVHVRPEVVVEIAFSDVQASPRYPAGLALRFARVKRYRLDKPASEADTLETVRAYFDRSRM